MTAAQAAQRFRTYRLLLIRNISKELDAWAIGTVRHIIEVRMQRKALNPRVDPPNPPPGPLAIRTGRLARTVRRDPVRYDGTFFRLTLRAGGPEAPYGRIHEFGGMAGKGHRSMIPARPYIGPSIADRERFLQPDIDRASNNAKSQAGIG